MKINRILTILPEDTGKNNYSRGNSCPIACALKRAGFKNVSVGTFHYNAEYDGKKIRGDIHFKSDILARDATRFTQSNPIYLKLVPK